MISNSTTTDADAAKDDKTTTTAAVDWKKNAQVHSIDADEKDVGHQECSNLEETEESDGKKPAQPSKRNQLLIADADHHQLTANHQGRESKKEENRAVVLGRPGLDNHPENDESSTIINNDVLDDATTNTNNTYLISRGERREGPALLDAPVLLSTAAIATEIDDGPWRRSIQLSILRNLVIAVQQPNNSNNANHEQDSLNNDAESDERELKGKPTSRWCVAGLIALTVVVALAVAVTITTTKKQSRGNSNIPSTPNERLEAYRALLLNHSVSSASALFNDVSSPQYKALTWLANHQQEQDQTDIVSNFDIIKERYILATLAFATNSLTDWTSKYFFLKSEAVCDWIGVSCDSDNLVKYLLLPNKTLEGSIPSEIGRLARLQELQITYNNFTGTIPSEIGMLQQLSELQAGSNLLTGSIPSEMGLLTNLQKLYLYENRLNGTIPTEIGKLEQILKLELGPNMLTGPIPSEIGNLTNLQVLYLYESPLTGALPSEIARLSQITDLQIAVNRLNGTIPSEIWRMTTLQTLYLDGNEFTGSISSDIGMLDRIQNLALSVNKLVGTIPREMARLTNLELLVLRNNYLTGSVPTEIGELHNLTDLRLHNNMLNGSIPSELGNLTALEALSLENNQFTGTIPSSLGLLYNLAALDVSANFLHGTVPTVLALLSNLGSFNVSLNNVTGNLTNFFCFREPPIEEFASDCLDPNEIVFCQCCTVCCHRGNNLNDSVCQNIL